MVTIWLRSLETDRVMDLPLKKKKKGGEEGEESKPEYLEKSSTDLKISNVNNERVEAPTNR